MTKSVNLTPITKLVTDIEKIDDRIARVAAATEAIAALRAAVGVLSAERTASVLYAKSKGTSYSELARATGMSVSRMAAIATGRGAYVPVVKAAPVKAAKAPAKTPASKSTTKVVLVDGVKVAETRHVTAPGPRVAATEAAKTPAKRTRKAAAPK